MASYDPRWVGILVVALSATAAAQERMSLQDAASRAVLTNPEISARLHTFRAAGHERRVAFGAYLPTLDAGAVVGKGDLDDPLAVTGNRYTYNNVTVVARQLLFDGFATSNDVKRLDHARRVRYFELLDVSEQAALEAIRAYQDVLRFQRLVEFAEENYATHRIVNDQLTQRAKQGVARGVDLELAIGRLALAESNLLTETSNLHDVSTRFQRIVGVPPRNLAETPPKPLASGLPSSPAAGLNMALAKSPALLASMENIQAAQSDVEVRRSAYYPRVEARVQHDTGKNVAGVTGNTSQTVAELGLRINLFNGRRDVARLDQYAEFVNVAKDQRDRACREVRQAVLVAMNDVQKLREQVAYLDQHQLSTDKARQAFRDQFDIGQRTLLDLLDTENEFFQSRRAYANADYDLITAYARVHAATGNLLAALGIAPVEMQAPPEVEPMGPDVAERCPAEGPDVIAIDRQKAIDKAMRLRPIRTAPPPGAVPAPAPAPAAKPK